MLVSRVKYLGITLGKSMSGETIAYYIFKKLVRDLDLCTDMLFIK